MSTEKGEAGSRLATSAATNSASPPTLLKVYPPVTVAVGAAMAEVARAAEAISDRIRVFIFILLDN